MMTSPNHFEWKDTRGKTALRIVLNPPGSIDYEVLEPNGTYQTTRVQFSLRTVRTKFACGGITEYSGNAWLPTRVDLPNGRAWTFEYEQTPPPANTAFLMAPWPLTA